MEASVWLSNKKCMTPATLIKLNPNDYSQVCHYYPFVVKLDRCVGTWNIFNNLSNKVYVLNKRRFKSKRVQHDYRNKRIENVKKVYIMECKCKFDRKSCKSDQWWNNDKWQCDCKKCHVREKDYVWNPPKCSCENGKYLTSIM